MSLFINSYRFAQVVKAVSLDGVNEYIEVPNDAAFDFERTDAFSYGITFNTNAIGATQALFGKESGVTYSPLALIKTNGRIQIYIANTWTSNAISIFNTSVLTADTDYTMVITYDGSSDISGCKCYLNGVDETVTTANNSLSASISHTNPLLIGARNGGTSTLDGDWRNFSIWDKELTSAEVTELGNLKCGDLTTHSAAANLVLYIPVSTTDDLTANTGVVEDKEGANDGIPRNTEVADLIDYEDC